MAEEYLMLLLATMLHIANALEDISHPFVWDTIEIVSLRRL